MKLHRNGALREDYRIFLRETGEQVAIMHATSAESAVTAFLTTRKKDRHDKERGKYVAHPMATSAELERFLALQPAAALRAYYKRYNLAPPKEKHTPNTTIPRPIQSELWP